jgi:ppGpp synthetase/RelA/SpoT-type nucleotidyltranferase
MEVPPVVKAFLKHYHLDHYEPLAACAAHLIEEALRAKGMKHWKTTSRAKTEESLTEKLVMRFEDKKYQSIEDIKKDIVDLAGVRIILYMPTEKEHEKVRDVIQSIWGKDVKPKLHPEPKKHGVANQVSGQAKPYQPRHLGYRAIHYRAEMKSSQTGMHGRVSYHWKELDMVEIQVVSALTHAWAEVGHDVLYKSYAYGRPTVQEERTLDALSGLVQSGELLLEQFQEMVHRRTEARWKHRDELETYLREVDVLQDLKEPLQFESDGLDVLLGFLTKLDKNYPMAVRTALKDLLFQKEHGSSEPPTLDRLDDIVAQFKPSFEPVAGLTAVICLIRHLLPQPYSQSATDLPSGKQCRVMMNAFYFLQRIFGQAELAYDYLKALPMTPEQKRSVDFVLASEKRQMFLRENSDQERDKPSLKEAWAWFQLQASDPQSICGLTFRLAEMGAMKDVTVYTLLESLSIGQFGSLSRSSTTSLEDEATIATD